MRLWHPCPASRFSGYTAGPQRPNWMTLIFRVTNLEDADGDMSDTEASVLHMDLVITADMLTCP
jgi:hypothetical protein